jgi:uncharacterized protein (DUF4415 family)
MEMQDHRGPDPKATRQTDRVEKLVCDQDPPALEAAAVPDGIHVTVCLALDVWRWLLAQGGDYHTRINALLRAQMDARGDAPPAGH